MAVDDCQVTIRMRTAIRLLVVVSLVLSLAAAGSGPVVAGGECQSIGDGDDVGTLCGGDGGDGGSGGGGGGGGGGCLCPISVDPGTR